MTVEELISKWGFEIEFEPLKILEEKFEEIQEKVLHIGEAALAAAGTMFGFAKFTADAGEAALLGAQRVGISVEAYQELAYAGKLVGLSSEEMGHGLMHLSRTLAMAQQQGGQTALVFNQMGINISQALKNPDQALMQIADRIKSMPDDGNKTALAMKVFGRAGAQLLPILNRGSAGIGKLREEAHALGVVLDKETAEESEEFKMSLERTEAAVVGVRNAIGIPLLKPLTAIAEKFADFIAENRKFIALKITAVFEVLGRFVGIVWSGLKNVWAITAALVDAFGGFERVLKLVALGLAIYTGGSLLLAIGTAATAVWAMVAAWEGLAAAEALADALALAIPIGIGLALVALGLIVEDLWVAFHGGNSVLKDLWVWFQDKFGAITTYITGLAMSWGKSLNDGLMSALQPVLDIMNWISEKFEFLTGKGAKSLLQSAGDLTNGVGAFLGFGGNTDSSVSAGVGVNPDSSPANGNSIQQQTNSIHAPVTVNVGDHASPMEVGRAARQGVTDAFVGDLLRGAHASFQGNKGD